jgi:hypothetical protein
MSENPELRPCTAFAGSALLATGPLAEIALAVKHAMDRGTTAPLLTFDDATGGVVDLDLRGSAADIVARLGQPGGSGTGPREAPTERPPAQEARSRGRPRLGVIAREVTLLPRHWDWLSAQAGGASVTLRRLVEAAQRGDGGRRQRRAAQEAAYRFMAAMAGDLPGFEEAARALFAGDRQRFERLVADWPDAVRAYAGRLAGAAWQPAGDAP